MSDEIILQINVRKVDGKYVATIDTRPKELVESIVAVREAASVIQNEIKTLAGQANSWYYGVGNKSK